MCFWRIHFGKYSFGRYTLGKKLFKKTFENTLLEVHFEKRHICKYFHFFEGIYQINN